MVQNHKITHKNESVRENKSFYSTYWNQSIGYQIIDNAMDNTKTNVSFQNATTFTDENADIIHYRGILNDPTNNTNARAVFNYTTGSFIKFVSEDGNTDYSATASATFTLQRMKIIFISEWEPPMPKWKDVGTFTNGSDVSVENMSVPDGSYSITASAKDTNNNDAHQPPIGFILGTAMSPGDGVDNNGVGGADEETVSNIDPYSMIPGLSNEYFTDINGSDMGITVVNATPDTFDPGSGSGTTIYVEATTGQQLKFVAWDYEEQQAIDQMLMYEYETGKYRTGDQWSTWEWYGWNNRYFHPIPPGIYGVFIWNGTNFANNSNTTAIIVEEMKDRDGDSIPDNQDNCPDIYNPEQWDSDGSGIGDACAANFAKDYDADGIPDMSDNCPNTYNPMQWDSNWNGIGDACDVEDWDGDTIPDMVDNCPDIYNPEPWDNDGDGINETQKDTDRDGIGDACDYDVADYDWDGINDDVDNCPAMYNPDQTDSNNNGIGDECDFVEQDFDKDGISDYKDNCPGTYNPDQTDNNGDGMGDACQNFNADMDADGIPDMKDNCPGSYNPEQWDSDGNGIGDMCDIIETDMDGDSIPDFKDNCPGIYNPKQSDSNGDGIGDDCQSIFDSFMSVFIGDANFDTFKHAIDTGGPGIDFTQNDLDQDGIPDSSDNCPNEFNPDQMDFDPKTPEGASCEVGIGYGGPVTVGFGFINNFKTSFVAQKSVSEVFGKVFDDMEGWKTIEKVNVTISNTTYNNSVNTTTDGSYKFQNLADGEYTVTITKTGYETDSMFVHLPWYGALDFWMRPELINLNGTIKQNTGDPIDGAWIDIKVAGKEWGFGYGASSDTNGYYEVQYIPGGKYKISVQYQDLSNNSEISIITDTTYNITLGTGGAIDGYVFQPDGSPAEYAWAEIEDLWKGDDTNTEGYFSITNVPAGTYTMRTFWWNPTDYSSFEAKNSSVTVTSDNTTAVNFTLSYPPGGISGMVEQMGVGIFSFPTPIGGANVTLKNISGPSSLFRETLTEPWGDFWFEDVPVGNYTVTVQANPGLGIKETTSFDYYGQQRNNLSVSINDMWPWIWFDVSSAKGDLTGRVTDGSGMGLGGIRIDLNNTGLTIMAWTDPAGYYFIPGLPEDSYEVNATPVGFGKFGNSLNSPSKIATIIGGETNVTDFGLGTVKIRSLVPKWQQIDAGETVTYLLEVENQGLSNSSIFNIGAVNKTDHANYTFNTTTVTLNNTQKVHVEFNVTNTSVGKDGGAGIFLVNATKSDDSEIFDLLPLDVIILPQGQPNFFANLGFIEAGIQDKLNASFLGASKINGTGTLITGGIIKDTYVLNLTSQNSTLSNASANFSAMFKAIIEFSDINSSEINNSEIKNFSRILDNVKIMDDSKIFGSNVSTGVNVYGSTFETSIVANYSTITNATITSSTLANTTVRGSEIKEGSNVKTSNIDNGTIDNSIMTGATINNGTIEDSNVTRSTVSLGSTIKGSSFILSNSLVKGSDINNSNISNSNIENGSTVEDGSTVTSKSKVLQSQIKRSKVENSLVDNTSLVNTTVINASVKDGLIKYGYVQTPSNITFQYVYKETKLSDLVKGNEKIAKGISNETPEIMAVKDSKSGKVFANLSFNTKQNDTNISLTVAKVAVAPDGVPLPNSTSNISGSYLLISEVNDQFAPGAGNNLSGMNVTYCYNESELYLNEAHTHYVNESTLLPNWYNGTDWDPLNESQILNRDIVENCIIFATTHASVYGLAGTIVEIGRASCRERV